MKTNTLALLLTAATASAHVTYTGRDFGAFDPGVLAPAPITISNLSSNFGWADATDADYGDSHRFRAFRFTLSAPGVVNISVQGGVGLLPGFSLYSGLAHVSPSLADHDGTVISQAYLTGLGTGPKEGSLFALGDWAIGNEPVYNIPGDPLSGEAIPASLSYLTYIGHAADGTAANYGSAPGIIGDGIADGFVAGNFNLPAGTYSLFIGGADYAASIGAVAPFTAYGGTVAVVPEPSGALLLALSSLGLLARRRR